MTVDELPAGVAVDDRLRTLYDGYYDVDPFERRKRELAAADSVAAVVRLAGPGPLNSIVDVGAGDGSVSAGLVQAGMANKIDALEISSGGVEAIGARDLSEVTAQLFDGYRIPAAERTFDLAVCAHVLEHVEHERLFLAEIARVARRAILIVPLEGGYRGRADAGGEHLNLYSPLTFRNLLATVGMRPVAELIYASSAAYERHLYGDGRGQLRNIVRRSLLRMAPRAAPHLMVYVMAILCDCEAAA